jgi:hypothetical protein
VDENVVPIGPLNKAVTLGVIKPLYLAIDPHCLPSFPVLLKVPGLENLVQSFQAQKNREGPGSPPAVEQTNGIETTRYGTDIECCSRSFSCKEQA